MVPLWRSFEVERRKLWVGEGIFTVVYGHLVVSQGLTQLCTEGKEGGRQCEKQSHWIFKKLVPNICLFIYLCSNFLSSHSWPWTSYPPASAQRTLQLQVYDTIKLCWKLPRTRCTLYTHSHDWTHQNLASIILNHKIPCCFSYYCHESSFSWGWGQGHNRGNCTWISWMLCFEFYRYRRTATATTKCHLLREHCIHWYIYIAGFTISRLHCLFIASAFTDILSHFLEHWLLEGTGWTAS